MSWLEKLMPSRIRTEGTSKRKVPEGLWDKCPSCSAVLYRSDLERNLQVCPKCNHHMRIGARVRLLALLDESPIEEIAEDLESQDFLKFKDSKKYKDRLSTAQKTTNEKEALIAFKGNIKSLPVVAASFDFNYMAGTMGSVVGEKFLRAAKVALSEEVPMICFSTSGGARMQEALMSLFQMSKTGAVLERMRERGLPSLAMLGDLNIAEPNALIGFAGPRVIQQTVRETLPEGFQRSEFLLEHGALDMIVDRKDMRDQLHELLSILTHADIKKEDKN